MNNRQRKKQQVKKQQQQIQKQGQGKSDVEKHKSIIKWAAGWTGTIVAVLALALQFFDIKTPLRSKPDADIANGSISVEYLKSIRKDAGEVYPLFQDTIDDSDNIFLGDCATQIFIANNYDDEIMLDKIIFEAQNIEVDTRPVLVLGPLNIIDDTIAGLTVTNTGWGDAENVELDFSGFESDIDKFLKEDKQKISIPLVQYGESAKLQIWNSEDFIDNGTFRIVAECQGKSGKIDSSLINNAEWLDITVQDGVFLPLARGGPSAMIYGIKIDTSDNYYKREEVISECIEPNGRLELPICFTADKSCNLNFRVGFEVIKGHNKKEIIWTDLANLELQISSAYPEADEAANYSQKELTEKAEKGIGFITITYPYVDKETLKYVEPYF